MTQPRIFISYSRIDDALPVDRTVGRGFVSRLRDELKYEFGQLGGPAPELWFDRWRIADGDPFDPLLDEGIQGASLLLVVLSLNWISRPYCLKELEQFAAQFKHEPTEKLQRRIVLARKALVPADQIPAVLPRQVGYSFYEVNEDDQVNPETPFFIRGEPGPTAHLKEAYNSAVQKLARHLWDKAHEFEPHAVAALPPPRAKSALPAPSGRTIFLAKPASDMKGAYSSLVEELSRRGHRIVPEPEMDLPPEGAEATGHIQDALGQADLAIHLLGESPGFAPENTAPIVTLQLMEASARIPPAALTDTPGTIPFHRLIWAPVMLPDAPPGAIPRDPQLVLGRLQGSDPATILRTGDKLIGDPFTLFVQIVVDHLAAFPRPAPPREPPLDHMKFYLGYDESDTEEVALLAETLQKLGHEPMIPGVQGDPAIQKQQRNEFLAKCDAVVLCWARAADVWVRSSAAELEEWDKLGRQQAFRRRSVVQLQPQNGPKRLFRRVPPRPVDIVVDATAIEQTVDQLAVLLREELMELRQ